MAISMGSAVAYLELDTSKFSSGFKSAYNDLKVFGDKSSTAEQKLKGVSSAMKGIGSTLSKNVTLPLAGVGAAAVKVSADFESGMSEVKAISGATGKDFEDLKSKAIEMGAKTKYSASEAAEAFKYMAMAGWDSQQTMDGISGVMNLTAASGEDLATTSDIVTDALTAFGLQAKDSAHFADVLAKTSSSSNTNVGLLGETFKYVAPVAGALKYSVEDTAVAIGLMANSGIKGSQAGTALRSTLTRLAKPVKNVQKAMDEYNISIVDSNGNMKPLNQLMNELRETFSGLTESEKAQLAATLAGQEGMSGLLAIVNASDKDFDSLTEKINNADGAAEDMAETMLDNLTGAVTILKSNLESAGIVIGNQLTPYIRKLAEWITTLVEKFNSLSPETQALIIRIGLIAAAIGPVLLVGQRMINMFLKLKGGITTVFGSISLFSQALGYAGKGMEDVAVQIGSIYPMFTRVQEVVAGISAVSVGVVAEIGVLIAAFVTLWKTNENFRKNITGTFTKIKESFESFASGVVERINELGFDFENVTEIIKTAWTVLCDFLSPVFEGAFSVIATVIDNSLNNILAVMDIFIGLFTGNWEQAFSGLQSWITGFISMVSSIGSTILSVIGSIGSKLLTMLGLDELAEKFQSFFDEISELFGSIPQLISGVVESIVVLFTDVVPSAIEGAIDSVKNFVDNALNSVIEFFTETIPNTFNNFVNVVVPNFINGIVTFFAQLPYNIGVIVGQFLGYIVLFGANLLSWVATTIPQVISNIVTFFSELPSKIWEWLVNTYNNVVQWGSDMKAKSEETGRNFLQSLISFFQTLPNRIATILQNLLSRVVSWGADMVAKAKSTAQNFVSSFISFLQSLPSKVWGIISQIPSKVLAIGSQLYNAGRSILNSLWDGIKSVGDSILGWFGDFANSIGSFVSGIVDGFSSVVSGANEAKSAAKSVNGSHANGLDYVPFNGYIAELHKGERVLTAQENEAYTSGRTSNGGDVFNFYNTKPSPYEYARQMKRAKKELLEEI